MEAYLEVVELAWETVIARMPSIVFAVVALFVGWVLARFISHLVGRIANRFTYSAHKKGLMETAEGQQIDRMVARVTYYLLMVLVLVQFFDILGITVIRGPFLAAMDELALAVPNLAKAIVILLAAWILATLLRGVTVRLVANERISRALRRMTVVSDEDQSAQLAASAGTVAYYLVLVMFLPAVLGALELEGLKGPFEQMMAQALGFLPRLVAASVTLLIGYVAAKIIRGVVSHFLANTGVDQLPAKVGMEQVFEKTPLSQSLGTIVFALVLLPVIISALESLGIAAISVPAVSMLTAVLNMVPNVAVALLLLAVGIGLARWVGQFTAMLLERSNTTQFLVKWGLLREEEDGTDIPGVVGKVVSGVIIMLILVEVFNVVKLTQMSLIVESILAYIPHVAVAVAILATGYAVAQFAQRSLGAVLRSTQYPLWLSSLAKYSILVLAGTMALEQLGVAEAVVVSAFTIILGSLGLAAAIAVGLGTKDVVQSWVASQSEKASSDKESKQG